jgi:Rps23 Pro-64 3,4-dihydroxylase Tpa1-like proline 4-hydroxylase
MTKTTEILSEKFKNLEQMALQMQNKYMCAKPFPHIQLKNFFDDYFLNEILDEFPDLNNINESEKYKNKNEVKLSYNKYENYPKKIKKIFDFLNSKIFLLFLQNITGIKENLISDPYLMGGGLHEIKKGGVLKVHTDFNRHPFFNLDRRINVLIYLNKDWNEKYGGQLELWDKDMKKCGEKISPIFNNLVIFSTTDFSNHGHPDPLNCPENISRKSLALYYFSSGRPESETVSKNMKNRTFFKSRAGFKNDANERKEYLKDYLRNFKIYKILKNFEKKYIRSKK